MSDRVRLHLLRHADAGDPHDWSAHDDLRPLSAEGELQSERLGRFLAASGFRPDVVLTSPKTRAARTAEIVAGLLGVGVTVEDRLGGGVGLATLEDVLATAGDPATPLLVGHDPDFSELASSLTSARLSMKKGAIVRIDAPRPLHSGRGELRWLVPPALLKPVGSQ